MLERWCVCVDRSRHDVDKKLRIFMTWMFKIHRYTVNVFKNFIAWKILWQVSCTACRIELIYRAPLLFI